ncbi:MAG: histidine phosphatase family protein [Anaerolineae bacterium]|nr:histidine phosphatase family protein [Anaerolineae bacterium]MDW8071722.1 histidine phosphatase family protein [Anaerolineae bacterium]
MTTVLLVRHGQTVWNREQRFRGQVEVPLDETGLLQAAALAQRIAAAWKPVAIYASPLQRTLQTAAPVARACGLEVIPHTGLLDINFGACTGLSEAEFATRHPQLAAAWYEHPHTVRFPKGEALADVQRRAVALLSDVVAQHPDHTVVLVTHLVVCRVLLCHFLGLDMSHFWEFEPAPASLSILEISTRGHLLRTLNDTAHLHELTAGQSS